MAIVITPISSLLLLLTNVPMKPLHLLSIVGVIGGVLAAFMVFFLQPLVFIGLMQKFSQALQQDL